MPGVCTVAVRCGSAGAIAIGLRVNGTSRRCRGRLPGVDDNRRRWPRTGAESGIGVPVEKAIGPAKLLQRQLRGCTGCRIDDLEPGATGVAVAADADDDAPLRGKARAAGVTLDDRGGSVEPEHGGPGL